MNVDFLNFLFIYYGELKQIDTRPRSMRRAKECTWHLRADKNSRHLREKHSASSRREIRSASSTITPE